MESIEELRHICQGPVRATDCIHGLIYGRRLSIYITRLLLHTSITANQSTLLFMLTGLLSAALFGVGGPVFNLLGALTMFLWYIFDNVDGEIARYRKTQSLTGEYWDMVVHFVVQPAIFFAIGWGYFRHGMREYVLLVGFALGMAQLLWQMHGLIRTAIAIPAIKRNRATACFPADAVSRVFHVEPERGAVPGASRLIGHKLSLLKAASGKERWSTVRESILNVKALMVWINLAAIVDLITYLAGSPKPRCLFALLLLLTVAVIVDVVLRVWRTIITRETDNFYSSITQHVPSGQTETIRKSL